MKIAGSLRRNSNDHARERFIVAANAACRAERQLVSRTAGSLLHVACKKGVKMCFFLMLGGNLQFHLPSVFCSHRDSVIDRSP